MRTDSKKYSGEFISKAETFIEKKYGKDYISPDNAELVCGAKKCDAKTIANDKKKENNAQEAHEAIRPTEVTRFELPDKMGPKEKKLYNLILRNTLESCMAYAVYISITASFTGAKDFKYKYSTEQVVFPGWKIVSGFEKENSIYNFLIKLKKGQTLSYNKIYGKAVLKELKTHYTEARLVQILEKKGIGRPSTFSSLISKIQERDYVKKGEIKGKKIKCVDFQLIGDELNEIEMDRIFGNEKNKLILQPVGKMVIEFLLEHFDPMFVYEYTSRMEDELDVISKGGKEWHTLCESCNEEMTNLSKKILNDDKEIIRIDAEHVYMIAKFGPVIKYQKGEQIVFKSVKKDLDLDKLKRGEYSLEEVVDDKKKTTNKILGNHKGSDVVLKKGKYGLYITWNGKNISLSSVNKTEKDMKMEDVVVLLEAKKSTNSNMLYQFDETLSIRKGKFGPYIFFKTEKMKRPLFKNFKGKHWENDFASKDKLREWIRTEHEI
jgi:DNA topoisomerase-1